MASEKPLMNRPPELISMLGLVFMAQPREMILGLAIHGDLPVSRLGEFLPLYLGNQPPKCGNDLI